MSVKQKILLTVGIVLIIFAVFTVINKHQRQIYMAIYLG